MLANKEYGLDLLDDLTDEELIELLLNAADLNSEQRAEAKEYLDYMMLNISQFVKSKTMVTVLNSMIFSSIGKILHGYKLEKYANIRTELAINLEHLKPYIKAKNLISINSYLRNKYFDNKIIFAQIDHYILNTCIQNTGKDKVCIVQLNQHISQ